LFWLRRLFIKQRGKALNKAPLMCCQNDERGTAPTRTKAAGMGIGKQRLIPSLGSQFPYILSLPLRPMSSHPLPVCHSPPAAMIMTSAPASLNVTQPLCLCLLLFFQFVLSWVWPELHLSADRNTLV
jgi:hypothetical protein